MMAIPSHSTQLTKIKPIVQNRNPRLGVSRQKNYAREKIGAVLRNVVLKIENLCKG
jgi:hypothetical protein